MGVGYTCHIIQVSSESNFWELVLSFYVGPRDQTQVSQAPLPTDPSHHPSPTDFWQKLKEKRLFN